MICVSLKVISDGLAPRRMYPARTSGSSELFQSSSHSSAEESDEQAHMTSPMIGVCAACTVLGAWKKGRGESSAEQNSVRKNLPTERGIIRDLVTGPSAYSTSIKSSVVPGP